MKEALNFTFLLLILVCLSSSFAPPSQQDNDIVGKWLFEIGDYQLVIEFKEDNTYTADMNLQDEEADIKGDYQTSNQELTFNDKSGKQACLGDAGKYHYKVEGDKLLLTLIEDGCNGRKNILTATPHATKIQ